ncbi:MAG: hypothetical protein QXY61_03135 [Candidatus Anstonellales archaeon]
MHTRIFLFFMLISCMVNSVVVINSFDGRDVVSGVYYAHVVGDTVRFVPQTGDVTTTVKKIGSGNSVFLIESKNNPVYSGLDVLLINNGNGVEAYKSEDPYKTNVELAKKSGAKNFILISPSYGYSAVSVLPYAKLKKAYLLFATKDNFNSLRDVLEDAESIMVYGYVDEEVEKELEGMGKRYEKINTGDKYTDNIEIVKKYFSLNPSKKQAILTDGNFLEDTIIAGDDPIIFISMIVPDNTYKFIKNEVEGGQLSVGLVIGEEYAQPAYNLKKRINNELGENKLSVLVKMGQSVPALGEQLLPLDIFVLPGPIVSLSIKEANYNDNTKAIELVYRNDGNALGYFKSSSFVYVGGKYLATVGDSEPVGIKPGEERGVRYSLEIPPEMEGDIVLNSTVIYGASSKTFDNGFSVVLNAGRIRYEDLSSLMVEEAVYDPTEDELTAKVRNNGNTNAYFVFSAEYSENGAKTTIEDDNVYGLKVGEGKVLKISNLLIKDPKKSGMKVRIRYGERAAFLDKTAEKEVEIRGGIPIWLILLALIILGIIAYFVLRRKKWQRQTL